MGPFFMHTPPRETTAEITSLSPSVAWNGTPTPGEVFVSRVIPAIPRIPAIPGIPGFPTLILYS